MEFTEADGKHNTLFRSLAALRVTDIRNLRHEHVSTRKQLKHKLLAAKSDEVDQILKEAIGCLVTVEEHERLSRYDGRATGWQRYELADVSCRDLRDTEGFKFKS